MRVLVVAEDVPNRDPVHGDGSSMISYEVLLSLPPTFEVTLVTFDRGFGVPPEVFARCHRVVVLPLEPRLWPRRLPALSNLGARARAGSSARRAVRSLSRAADVTLLHGPLTLGLVHAVVGPLVVQTVDPWSQSLASVADSTRGLKRAYWLARAWASAFAERETPRRARLLTVGELDARRWSELLGRPVRAVPNGVRIRARAPRVPRQPTVCFVGSLDYQPNIDAAGRLVHDVLPIVRVRFPGVRVLVAGRNPTPEIWTLATTPGAEVRPDVRDMADVFDDVDVAVFPDRHGTGVRNTVQEALASGLPVVATPVAARGLKAHPSCTVAASDEDLAAATCAWLERTDGRADAPVVAPRTWAECAADYAAELRSAVDAGRDPAGRHRRAAHRLRR